MKKDIKKAVLAYSGGLDTSVIIQWLKEEYGCEVVAYCADVGQDEDLKPLRAKAIKSGASEVYIKDLREEFVKDYVFPMLRAGAVYESSYLLGTSIARPIIAKAQMDVAAATGADAVSHGATGKGNDQVRFELTYYAQNPNIHVIAPWREWTMKGRSDLVKYAKAHNIHVPVTKKKPYSMDGNLLHISYEGGPLEDPWAEPPKDMFRLTRSIDDAPQRGQYVEIDYEGGNPVAVDGKRLSPGKLLQVLNKMAGRHGVGRVDIVESRYVGMKSRGVYETPGGTILHEARKAVESLTMDRDVMHMRDGLSPRYAELVYNGYWFTPERRALQALVDEASSVVSGTARLKLHKGSVITVGRRSGNSIYNEEVATFEEDSIYDQKDAEGFIKVNALRLKIEGMVEKGTAGKGKTKRAPSRKKAAAGKKTAKKGKR